MGWLGKLAAVAFFTGAMFYAAHKLNTYAEPVIDRVDYVVERVGNEIAKQYEKIRENLDSTKNSDSAKDISDKLKEEK